MRMTHDQLRGLIAESPALRRELEKYYRRGFSQGAAAGAYAAAKGATAADLEAWRCRVLDWRVHLDREAVPACASEWPWPETLVGGAA